MLLELFLFELGIDHIVIAAFGTGGIAAVTVRTDDHDLVVVNNAWTFSSVEVRL